LAGLRAIPAVRLADAVEALHLPLVDGVVVPDERGILFARGEQHDVPFVTGADSYDGAVVWLVIGEEPLVQAGVAKDRLDFLERQYLRRVGGL
jgi:hypothetical protein